MDKLGRAIQRSEEMFFDECDTRNVPIIVLFTKFDALLTVAMGKLSGNDKRLPLEEKKAKAHELIEGIFDNANVWGRLCQLKHAPKCSVRIGGMQTSNEGCSILLENTAGALNDEALQVLFVTAQERSIALCMRYAIQNVISILHSKKELARPGEQIENRNPGTLARWFPHFW